MSSLTGYTKQQVQVLWAVDQLRLAHTAATGATILHLFRESPQSRYDETSDYQGLHITAASLVRKGALHRGHTGTHTVAYSMSVKGKVLLDREVEAHGAPL